MYVVKNYLNCIKELLVAREASVSDLSCLIAFTPQDLDYSLARFIRKLMAQITHQICCMKLL